MLEFTEKQKQLVHMFKANELKRLNILEGSVRSGKTWISLILWAVWVASRPKEHLYMMCAKSLKTLKRNCLLPLQGLIGERNFTFSEAKKEGVLFGRKIMLEGANDERSESKIRGITLGGAYCDELTLFPKDFFVMLLSRLSTPGAKLIATTNPDVPTHWLLTEYLNNDELSDELFRMFFHIDDNTTLDSEYVTSLKTEYTGVYYDRFILGLWVVAAGAIYKVFSNDPVSYEADPEALPCFGTLNIGLDFGGNGSAHALAASGITPDFRTVYALKTVRINAADVSPLDLYEQVYAFCEQIIQRYGNITALYADNAEQTLRIGLRKFLKPLGVYVRNAIKRRINDRIRATTMLMAGGRFKYIAAECKSLSDALKGAVWNKKNKTAEERLDDGTSDIDTLDAFEYSIERHIPQMIQDFEDYTYEHN